MIGITIGELAPTRVQNLSRDAHEIGGNRWRRRELRLGYDVESKSLQHGIFDDASVSVILSETVSHFGQEAGIANDPRRFRANMSFR